MLALACLTVVLAPAEARETQSTPAAASGYILPDTESWDLSSPDGQVYRIFVSRPRIDAPAEGFPVLYILDGNAMFAGFAEARRLQAVMSDSRHGNVGNSIIVGIGYPTEQPYDLLRRLYDFTPAMPRETPPSQMALAKYRTGGNEQFADFLINRIRPEVAKRYRVNTNRQALFGHSLGGLFALHMLYSRPSAFHAIIAASPSIWWNEQDILAEERSFGARLSEATTGAPVSRLLLLTGEQDESGVEKWDARSLAARLWHLSAFGLRSDFEMFRDETHITVPHRAITPTLRFAFSWP